MKTTNMIQKTIAKVIVYYTDGTFQEVESQTKSESTSSKTFSLENTVGNLSVGTFNNVPLSLNPSYSWSMGYMDTMTGLSDGAPITNKYTITSTGNGHVEVQG